MKIKHFFAKKSDWNIQKHLTKFWDFYILLYISQQ